MESIESLVATMANTIRIPVTDISQMFTDAHYTLGDKLASNALITCEAQDVRFTFGAAVPTQGVNGLGHILYTRQSIKLQHISQIRSFSFINHTNGSDAIIQVTFEFPIGG